MDQKQNGDDDKTKEQETEKKDVKQTCEDTANSITNEQNTENEDVKTTFDDKTDSSGVRDAKEDPKRDINTSSANTENPVSEPCQNTAEEITPKAETNNEQVDETPFSSSITANGEASNGLEGTMYKTATGTDEKCQNETPGLVVEDEVTQQKKKCQVWQSKKESEDNIEQLQEECQDTAEVLKQREEKDDEEVWQQKEEDQDSTENGQQKVKGHDAREAGKQKDESEEKSEQQKQEGTDTIEAGKQKEKREGDDRQQKEESEDEAGQKQKGQATTATAVEKEEIENEGGQPKEEDQDTTGVGQGKEADQEESQNKTEQQKQESLDTTEIKTQMGKNEDNDGQQREVGQNAADVGKQKEEREDEAGRQKEDGIDITEERKDMKGKNQQNAVEPSCSETQTESEIPVGTSDSTEATEENTGPNMSEDERQADQPEMTDEQKQGSKSDQQDENEKNSKQKEKEQESEESKSPENNVDKDTTRDTCDENKTALESEHVSLQDRVSAQSKDLPSETDQAVVEDSKTSQNEDKLTDTIPEKAQSEESSQDEGKLIGNHQADVDDPNKITQSETSPNENIPGENLDKFKETEQQQTSLFAEEVEKGPPIAYLIEYCEKCKPKFVIEFELETIKTEYKDLQERAKTCGYEMSTIWPPSERNAILNNDNLQNASSPLQNFILKMHEQSAKRGDEAVTEYIQVSTYALKEHTSKTMLNRQTSLSEKKKKKKQRTYSNCLEKLLDIEEGEWNFDKFSRHSVLNDYTHLLSAESVLKYNFPEDNVLNYVKINITNPDQVPPEYHHRALYQFLFDINSTEYGVDKTEMWTEYGRLVVAERQLALARRAVGPDLDKNVIVDKKNYHKMQNELKAKIDEVEELSTRLSRFASQQLTEGNPNIADLSDTHRPTRLGEMYSQLFDDEWSEAFEAFKPKYEDDDDIFPDTLFILQNLLMKVFEFCQVQSKKQMFDLEKTLGKIIGIGEASHIDSSTPVESETLPTGDNDKGQGSDTDVSKNQGEKADHCHKDSEGSNDETKSETQPENVRKEEHQEVEQKEKDINADDRPETTENQNEQSDELKENTFDKNDSSAEQTKEIKDEELNEGSEEDVIKEEDEWESREKDQTELMIERHARDFRKAAATPSAISKAKAFIEFELPKLVEDKEIREDERTVTYINKCVELCWYMCMQDPPMTIVSPSKGETIDKAEFSHHGRRGKFVETCVWPALLLHEKGPLVCKGYVLPQNRKK